MIHYPLFLLAVFLGAFNLSNIFAIINVTCWLNWSFSLLSLHCECTVYNVKYTLYSVLYTLYSVQYTLYSVQYTLYSVQYTLCGPHLPAVQHWLTEATTAPLTRQPSWERDLCRLILKITFENYEFFETMNGHPMGQIGYVLRISYSWVVSGFSKRVSPRSFCNPLKLGRLES